MSPVRTGSVQDELQRLTGSTNDPQEIITTSHADTPVYFGPDRAVQCRLQIAGAVTGTNPTLLGEVQICSDAAGTGAVTVATFPEQIASHAAAIGSLAADPTVIARTTAAKPYVRMNWTIGGTSTPTFNAVQVLTDPVETVVS